MLSRITFLRCFTSRRGKAPIRQGFSIKILPAGMEIFVRKLCMALTGSGPHYLCGGKSYATRAMTPIEMVMAALHRSSPDKQRAA